MGTFCMPVIFPWSICLASELLHAEMIFFMQVNQQFKKKEPLEYEYDVCEAILLWEQVKQLIS